MLSSMVFLGVHGSVIAVDRATGQQFWSVHLKGSGFVSILVDEVRVLAATHGEIFLSARRIGPGTLAQSAVRPGLRDCFNRDYALFGLLPGVEAIVIHSRRFNPRENRLSLAGPLLQWRFQLADSARRQMQKARGRGEEPFRVAMH